MVYSEIIPFVNLSLLELWIWIWIREVFPGPGGTLSEFAYLPPDSGIFAGSGFVGLIRLGFSKTQTRIQNSFTFCSQRMFSFFLKSFNLLINKNYFETVVLSGLMRIRAVVRSGSGSARMYSSALFCSPPSFYTLYISLLSTICISLWH